MLLLFFSSTYVHLGVSGDTLSSSFIVNIGHFWSYMNVSAYFYVGIQQNL